MSEPYPYKKVGEPSYEVTLPASAVRFLRALTQNSLDWAHNPEPERKIRQQIFETCDSILGSERSNVR